MKIKKLAVTAVIIAGIFTRAVAMAGADFTYRESVTLNEYLHQRAKVAVEDHDSNIELLEAVASQGILTCLSTPQGESFSAGRVIYRATLGNLVAAVGTPIAACVSLRSRMTKKEIREFRTELTFLLVGKEEGDTIYLNSDLTSRLKKFFNAERDSSVYQILKQLSPSEADKWAFADTLGEIMRGLLKKLDIDEAKIDDLLDNCILSGRV